MSCEIELHVNFAISDPGNQTQKLSDNETEVSGRLHRQFPAPLKCAILNNLGFLAVQFKTASGPFLSLSSSTARQFFFSQFFKLWPNAQKEIYTFVEFSGVYIVV